MKLSWRARWVPAGAGACSSWPCQLLCLSTLAVWTRRASHSLRVSVRLLVSLLGLLCESKMISSFRYCPHLLNIALNLEMLVPYSHLCAKIRTCFVLRLGTWRRELMAFGLPAELSLLCPGCVHVAASASERRWETCRWIWSRCLFPSLSPSPCSLLLGQMAQLEEASAWVLRPLVLQRFVSLSVSDDVRLVSGKQC